MSITGTTDIGDGVLSVTVDHDPTVVTTDAPAGSLIIDANAKIYIKIDDGPTTNVKELVPKDSTDTESVRQYRGVADSNKAGTTTLNHNNFSMSASATNSLVLPFHTPLSWDPDQDPQIHVVGFTVGTGVSQNYRFEYGIESGPPLMVIDGIDDETLTYTQAAPDAASILLYGELQTISRATLGLAPNDHMNVVFRKLGGDPLDNRPSNFRFIHTMLIWPRLKGSFEITS